MKIIKEEIISYPTKENDGLYPDKLRGNLFRVQGIIQTQYIQSDGKAIWSLPNCLAQTIADMKNYVRRLEDAASKYKPDGDPTEPIFQPIDLDIKNTKDRKVPVDDIVKLADYFGADGIVRLKKEGII